MRFLSSSALAKAPKLRLAASCSAAETICLSLGPMARVCRGHHQHGTGYRSSQAGAPGRLWSPYIGRADNRAAAKPAPTGAAYSSLAAAFGLVVLAFLAADFLRFSSSAGRTFFSIEVIDPPALSIAALAPAVA